MNRKQLADHIRQKESFLCVGLDPDIKKLPVHLLCHEEPLFDFCKAIVDATAPFAVAYKPNLAFFEAQGMAGIEAFEKTVAYIRNNYPELFIIADAKRGDIGNTSALYARTFFEHSDVDAVTVAPYMGADSVKPFLGYEGRWVVLLALTSNPGSADFQMLTLENGRKLYQQVLHTSKEWAGPDEMMYVVGATRAEMLSGIREIIPDSFLLVPGVGAQGGSLEEVCLHGLNSDCGLLVNSSRGIIYASGGEDFAEASAAEAGKLQKKMAAELRKKKII